MKLTQIWGPSRSSKGKAGIVVRFALAFAAVIGSFALAYALIAGHNQAAHAAGTPVALNHKPWGLALDGSGNLWIAEPDCSPTPVCGGPSGSPTPTTLPPPAGAISKYTTGGVLTNYPLPATGGYSAPEFIAVDHAGNVWFTMPSTDALGEYSVGGTFSIYTTGITAGAHPRDLVIDNGGAGNIWFTEGTGNKIGFFNTTSHAIVETPVTTVSADPYGIVISGTKIWFSENGSTKLGSFTPTATGTITIAEFPIGTVHPHMLAADPTGNLWYSEGTLTSVGEYTPTTASFHDYSVATAVCPPTPASCANAFVSGITVDKNGAVWFDEGTYGNIGVLNPANGNVASTNTANSPYEGMVVDANGNVWASSQFNFSVTELVAGTLPVPTGSPVATITPPANLGTGPTNLKWYFAEGRVGAGFREYLTIQNPNTVACPVNITYFYTIEGSTVAQTLPVNVTIPPNSRLTRAVHGDLGITDSTVPAAAVSAVVTAGAGCPGIVAERPIYFAGYHGILSAGTDALGVTKLGQTFNFADFPYDANNLSFITVLNPQTTAATVTATFYSAGLQVATEQISVAAGSRGTLFPNLTSAPLPVHTAVVVTSTQLVAVERPSYFLNSNGSAGASDVIGVPAPGNDWLFAEGFTGTGFQENLTIANVTNAVASATVTLRSQTGGTFSTVVSVGAFSQQVVNVNALNTTANFPGATPEVSAEVISTGSTILVQRQLYFTYHHSFTEAGFTQFTAASGVTDVMGQLGPLTTSAYTFAEGYTNLNYNEWLTVQNPTANVETVWVTIVNELSQKLTVGLIVPAHSRQTLDVTDTVRRYLTIQYGPGAIPGNQVSLTVQTVNNGGAFLVERPMYWNTAGTSFVTQGGSDIAGYAGG